MKVNVLGVEIDKIEEVEVVKQVEKWVKTGGKHYIVTPNIEFVMLAQQDQEFRRTINKADLAIPDSARIGWADCVLRTKGLKKLLLWPFFLWPKVGGMQNFPVTTGTDLMEKLVAESSEKGFTIGLLGGQKNVALKLLERLKKKYPKLKVGLASGEIKVNNRGEVTEGEEILEGVELRIDILFVAFGQQKQEKWISQNLMKTPVKIMIGVGGAFDYLSGDVSRAPKWLRNLGFEWLYRVVVQPWRIKRFGALVRFVFLVLFS
jgi:N-acetylglucosaminyldiphosphoundecaprenol N-acetyl-beta-D-mannosaminyltransferase